MATANAVRTIASMAINARIDNVIGGLCISCGSRMGGKRIVTRLSGAGLLDRLGATGTGLTDTRDDLGCRTTGVRHCGALCGGKLIDTSRCRGTLLACHRTGRRITSSGRGIRETRAGLKCTAVASPVSKAIVSGDMRRNRAMTTDFGAPRLFAVTGSLAGVRMMTGISRTSVNGMGRNSQMAFAMSTCPSSAFRKAIGRIQLRTAAAGGMMACRMIVSTPGTSLGLGPNLATGIAVCARRHDNILTMTGGTLHFAPAGRAINGSVGVISYGNGGGI